MTAHKDDFDLFGELIDARKGRDAEACPALWYTRDLVVTSITYERLATPVTAIMRRIATLSFEDAPELIQSNDTTGAGTTVTITLQSPTAETAASRAALNLQHLAGVIIDIGLVSAAAGTGTLVVTWVSENGVAQSQTVVFNYPTSGVQGRSVRIILLPGQNVRGSYQFCFATVAPAMVTATEASARTATFAFSGMPNNTQISVRAVNANHEDAQRLAALFAHADNVALDAASERIKQRR